MSPELWSIATVGIVILIAIATSNRSLRREMSERIVGVQRELGERIDRLNERVSRLSERVDRLNESLGDVRERLGRVEGLMEHIGLTWRQRADKERGEDKGRGEKQTPAPPRS